MKEGEKKAHLHIPVIVQDILTHIYFIQAKNLKENLLKEMFLEKKEMFKREDEYFLKNILFYWKYVAV